MVISLTLLSSYLNMGGGAHYLIFHYMEFKVNIQIDMLTSGEVTYTPAFVFQVFSKYVLEYYSTDW